MSEKAGNVVVVSTSGRIEAAVSPLLAFKCVASGRQVRVHEDSFEEQPAVTSAQQGDLVSAVVLSRAAGGSSEANDQACASLSLCSPRGNVTLRCRSWRSSIEQRLQALRGG